jgi:hypothetical protein
VLLIIQAGGGDPAGWLIKTIINTKKISMVFQDSNQKRPEDLNWQESAPGPLGRRCLSSSFMDWLMLIT